MALIKCPDCEKEISDQANECVHCGYPISKQPKPSKEITPKETNSVAGSGITEEPTKAIKAFLKNKKAVTAMIITVLVIVLAIIAACAIYNCHMEKVTLEQIEEHIENEEYEFAFDKINSGYISDEDMEKYREIVVPHMQDEFADAKKSERETLSLIVAGQEYFINEGWDSDEIYIIEEDDHIILYTTPEERMDYVADSYFSWSYHLDSKLTMYANNGIFFMETCYSSTLSSSGLDGDDLYVALKYLDLSTGIAKEIGSDEYFRGMYKLEDGSIFVQYSYYYHDGEYPPKRNPCGGIRYNPYTKAINEGENVVTEKELEQAVYKCN